MSLLMIIYLAISVPSAVACGRVWYSEGSSDGWISPRNLRASIPLGILYGVCWPVFLTLIICTGIGSWIMAGNRP